MPVNAQAVGKSYEPTLYAVGREKVREYARAVGETNPLYLDLDAARAAGHADVVAPPMFAVVYGSPAIGPAIFDPEIGINFAMMVHGAQEFEWGPLVVAGDEITTTASVKDISDRAGLGYYVFESISTNQRDEQVCRGTWTQIVRGV
jgi:acyl dehydratase